MRGKVSNESTNNQIIIIDSNNEDLKILSALLEPEGYFVTAIDHGKVAIQVVENHHPALLFIDTKMPGVNGFEICRKFKSQDENIHIPVIFMGAPDDKELMIKGYQAGGADYLSKPFCHDEVLAKVSNHIRLYSKFSELKARNEYLEDNIIHYRNEALNLKKRIQALTQPLDDSKEFAFDELFNINDLQKLQDQFAYAFGIASIITTPDGVPITQPSNFSKLCRQIIRKTEKGLKNCMHSDSILGCQNLNGPIVMPCLSGGLLDAGASISIGGRHVANWLIGQIRNENTDENKLKEYAKEIGADEQAFMDAYYEVTPMPLSQFQKIAEVLYTMAGQLSVISYQNVQQAQYIKSKNQAEAALIESEERFRTILYSIGDGVITTDTEGRVKVMNSIAEQLTGWTQSEASGRLLEEVFHIVHEETRRQVEIPVRRVLREGVIVGLANHTVLIAKDGTEYPIADSGAPIRTDKGEIIGVVLVFRDQSVEREVEHALRESESKFRSLFESSSVGISVTSMEGFLNPNRAFTDMLGYTENEIRNINWREVTHPDDIQRNVDVITSLVKDESPSERFEKRYIHKNGKIVWTDISITLQRDNNNQPAYFITIINDITKRKIAEETLRDSEFFFRESQHAAFIGSYNFNLITGYWESSEVLDQIFGIDKDYSRDINGWNNLIFPEDLEVVKQQLKELVAEKKYSVDEEYRIVRKLNGEVRWVNGKGHLILDHEGKTISLIGTIQDITDRKRTEEALRESEERYDAFVNANADMIFVKDDQLRYLMANEAMASFFGKAKAELINKTDEELADNKRIYPCKSSDLKVLESETTYKTEEKLGDRIYETTKFPLQLSGHKRGIGGIIRDITESKISAERIKNERQLLRTVIDNLPVTIYVKDCEGRKIIANKADLEIIGVASEAEVLGKTDLETFNNEIGKRGFEDDLKVIKTGQPVINREEIFFKKNGEQQWLLTSKIPLHDQKGNITGLVGIGRDITEQKKANETILKFSKSIEQSPSTIVITDVNGNIEYVNPKFTEVTGYTLAEVLG
ncbi:MAG TPA: PAS domain S-box protein, partial [Prolixibacteraceae bacterium]|nr:PAS domain S-box protein [Prolixibacteraceae bacterium]